MTGVASAVLGAWLGMAPMAARLPPMAKQAVVVTIRASGGTYECADGDVARLVLTLRLGVANATERLLAVPTQIIDFGSERYWKAGDQRDLLPRVKTDGVLIVSAGQARPPRREDFVVLAPKTHHTITTTKGVVVTRSGEPVDGLLVAGSYRSELQVGPGSSLAQDAEVLRRLEAELGMLWMTTVWSEPFEFRVDTFPERLPRCTPH